MSFLQPLMLWGALAVIIPVIIHFWHQKKGKTIAWAATQWLMEKNQQQSRGLRLDNYLLLILRLLLLILLAILLSQPLLNGWNDKKEVQKIHLVQPNAFLVNNFRFELEEALKKGEQVYWMNGGAEPVQSMAELPAQAAFNPMLLQTIINNLPREKATVHLYLVNNQGLAKSPFIHIPNAYKLHAVIDSTSRPVQDYVKLTNNKNLFVNRSAQLTTGAELDKNIRFNTAPIHTGKLSVLLDYRNKAEEKTVEAALNALTDVYSLDMAVDVKRALGKAYDWVLTDREIREPAPQVLYTISGQTKTSAATNVVYTSEVFTPQTAERVENGGLPEWLGNGLIRHFGLASSQAPLSQQQLTALFIQDKEGVTIDQKEKQQQEKTQQLATLLFVLLIGIERWIALKRNA
jgi:hypothetical protein